MTEIASTTNTNSNDDDNDYNVFKDSLRRNPLKKSERFFIHLLSGGNDAFAFDPKNESLQAFKVSDSYNLSANADYVELPTFAKSSSISLCFQNKCLKKYSLIKLKKRLLDKQGEDSSNEVEGNIFNVDVNNASEEYRGNGKSIYMLSPNMIRYIDENPSFFDSIVPLLEQEKKGLCYIAVTSTGRLYYLGNGFRRNDNLDDIKRFGAHNLCHAIVETEQSFVAYPCEDDGTRSKKSKGSTSLFPYAPAVRIMKSDVFRSHITPDEFVRLKGETLAFDALIKDIYNEKEDALKRVEKEASEKMLSLVSEFRERMELDNPVNDDGASLKMT